MPMNNSLRVEKAANEMDRTILQSYNKLGQPIQTLCYGEYCQRLGKRNEDFLPDFHQTHIFKMLG